MSKQKKPPALKLQRRDPLASLKMADMMISKPVLPAGTTFLKSFAPDLSKLNRSRGSRHGRRLPGCSGLAAIRSNVTPHA